MQVSNKKFTVYRLIFPNKKSYIGITSRLLSKRLQEHKDTSKAGKQKLYAAIRKYGYNSIQCEILLETYSKEECYDAEIKFIEKYNSQKEGYNSSAGGENGGYGSVRSFETCRKISETKRKNPYRWKDNPEALKRRIQTQLGRKQTDLQKQRAREANSHNHLVYYTDGRVINIKGLKAYSLESGIPFDTLRYSLYNSRSVPSWNIEKIIKA